MNKILLCLLAIPFLGAHDVKISNDIISQADIKFAKAAPQKLTLAIERSGWIEFDPDKVAHVTLPLNGQVKEVYKTIGHTVEKNAPLALFTSQDAAEKRLRYHLAEKNENSYRAKKERAERLYDKGIYSLEDLENSEKDYLSAEHEKKSAFQDLLNHELELDTDLNIVLIRSPIKGEVVERHAVLGEWINENSDIFTLADLSSLWAEFPLFASEIEPLKSGGRILIDGKTVELLHVTSTLNEGSLNLKGVARLENHARNYTPGTPVKIDLVLADPKVEVAVKTEAIQTLDGKPHLFVKSPSGIEAREVTLGIEDKNYTEIISGLDAGEIYAVKNAFRIKADLGKEEVEHDD